MAQLISHAVFNRPVAATSWTNEDEELGKHILAILQEGHSCVLFDNIREGSSVKSSRLAMAMSSELFGGRVLGENRTVQLPSSVIWLFTGNGIDFSGDFATRVYPININPDMADPNTRSFKRTDIGKWAMDNRKKIISAILSIVMVGKKCKKKPTAARFKLWDKFVRMPLEMVSGIDINTAVKNNQKSDPFQITKRDFVSHLAQVFGKKKFTTKDILAQAYENFDADNAELRGYLEDILGKRSRNSMSVGRFLSSIESVVFPNYTLKKKQSNVVRWLVIEN
jgi:hypothetical protein